MSQTGIFLKKQWFLNSKKGKIENYYNFDIKRLIGSGTYGNVVKAIQKGGNEARALKIIQKDKVTNKDRFRQEIQIMQKLDHPNVLKFYETFEDQRNIYLVLEICEGGELFDRIVEAGFFDENDARRIFKDIMQAINYCHQNKIAHRDLKPENFLFLTKDKNSPIKIIDFGLSTMFDSDTINEKLKKGLKANMTTKAGTPFYISPEVLEGDYDESCDIWSAGVILYILLSGVPPFFGDTDEEIFQSVKTGEFTFDIPEFEGVSESAKNLISKMLTKPNQRLNSEQVLQHPWFQQNNQVNKELKLNIASLKNFQNNIKLKKAALTFIASQCNEKEILELGQLFKQLDENADGALTIDEIKKGLENQEDVDTHVFKELQKIITTIDTDGNGIINYTEFIAATIQQNLYLKEEKIYQAFRAFDIDGNGKISAEELKQVLGSENSSYDEAYWNEMIKEADLNGDGEIDYNEFLLMMQKK